MESITLYVNVKNKFKNNVLERKKIKYYNNQVMTHVYNPSIW